MQPAPNSPSTPNSQTSSSYSSTSNLIPRGSAPPGVFDIPTEGLRVSETKSFLARFQAAIRNKARENEEPSDPPNPHPSPTTAEVTTEEQPESKPRSSRTINNTHHTNPPASNPEMPAPSLTEPLPSPRTPRRSGPSPDATASSSPKSAALETAANKAENDLINVLPHSTSILSERRSSYPILRFCAGSALVDQHALDTLSLQLGFVWAPFGPTASIPRLSRLPNRCGTCGSFLAPANGAEAVKTGQRLWTCVFCGRDDNDSSDLATEVLDDESKFPELSLDSVEYVHPESATRSPTGRGAVILIVDENLDPEEAQWSRAAAAAVHASAAADGSRFALLTVSAGCSAAVKRRDHDSMAPALEMLSPKRARSLHPEEKERFFLQPPHTEMPGHSGTHDESTLVRPYTDVFIRPWSLRSSITEHLGHETPAKEGSDVPPKSRTRGLPEDKNRRLDIAIHVSFELISGMADPENSRVLCLLTGPPTLPPLPVESRPTGFFGKTGPDPEAEGVALSRLFEYIGTKAGDLRIALDFLCFGGSHGFAAAVLLAAAKRSRGGLVYAASHSFSTSLALAEAASFLSRRPTKPGVVSIRVSSPLVIARVIGPAFPTAAPQTYAVPGVDPTAGFTVVLKPKQGVEEDSDLPACAVVQLAAKSLELTRVVTVRIPVTNSIPQYLKSIDAEICALVLGKACVVSGGALFHPHIATRSIDVTVRRLLRGSEASAGVVRLLYELRRGLLIERQADPDCALILRSFFLRAETSIASLLMAPRLFSNAMSDEGTGLMAEVPLQKSYVTQTAVLVLDTGFNIFVYVGEYATAEAEEAISESARSVAAQRLVPCQLWKLRPGDDAEYLLDSYLSPADPVKMIGSGSPTEQGFIQYCKSLAPDSITVRLMQSA